MYIPLGTSKKASYRSGSGKGNSVFMEELSLGFTCAETLAKERHKNINTKMDCRKNIIFFKC